MLSLSLSLSLCVCVCVCVCVCAGHKQFLPRLGAPIRSITISSTGNLYGLCCTDNTIRIINAMSSEVEQCIVGLQCADTHTHTPTHTHTHTRMPELVVEPAHQWVVLSGKSGVIQFYDIVRDVHVGDVCVVHRNVVSRTGVCVCVCERERERETERERERETDRERERERERERDRQTDRERDREGDVYVSSM